MVRNDWVPNFAVGQTIAWPRFMKITEVDKNNKGEDK